MAKVQARLRASASSVQHPADHLDPGGTQGVGTPSGEGAGVGLGVDDAGHPGVEQGLGARTGAAGVVAGLEADVGGAAAGPLTGPGERVHLGVRGARAAVVALADHGTVAVDDDGADAGVGVGLRAERGQLEGTAHQRGVALVVQLAHVLPLVLGSCRASSGAVAWSEARLPAAGLLTRLTCASPVPLQRAPAGHLG